MSTPHLAGVPAIAYPAIAYPAGTDPVLTDPGGTAVDPRLQSRIDRLGAAAALRELIEPMRVGLASHVADPMATNARSSYVGWIRRQATAWTTVPMPAVHIASLDWPLSSVRPQCLDVVGLLLADLRELSPGGRATAVPGQAGPHDPVRVEECIAAAQTCITVAELAAPGLAAARRLTAGLTRIGTATRYLERCVELAERADGFGRELDGWAVTAGAERVQHTMLLARELLTSLFAALDTGRRTGW